MLRLLLGVDGEDVDDGDAIEFLDGDSGSVSGVVDAGALFWSFVVVGVEGVVIVVVVIVVVDEGSCFGVDNIDGDDVPPSKLMIGEGETATDIFL